MAGALYILILIMVFAGIGRLSIPQLERMPLRTWTTRDVYFNTRRGVNVLSDYGPHVPFMDNPRDPPDIRNEHT